MEAGEAEAIEEEEGVVVVVVEHDVLIVSWSVVVSALELAVQKPVFFVSHVSPLNPHFVWCGLHLTLVP